jgi:hypothetical protein
VAYKHLRASKQVGFVVGARWGGDGNEECKREPEREGGSQREGGRRGRETNWAIVE